MINGQKVIAVIPARGGSKSIPYKNIKPFLGKPLIAWTIASAQGVAEIDRIIVSTEDALIAEVASRYGAEVFNRPAELAKDNSLSIELVKDIVKKLKEAGENYSIMLYLEPTSPLRESQDIRTCLELLTNTESSYTAVATFTEAELNPHRAWRIEGSPELFIKSANPWLPRQKLPRAYQLNGAVYCFLIESIQEDSQQILNGSIGAVVMPREKSVDIDDKIDFMLAELLMKERIDNEKP